MISVYKQGIVTKLSTLFEWIHYSIDTPVNVSFMRWDLLLWCAAASMRLAAARPAVFSTCFSTCVARAACFVFCSVSLTIFLFSFCFFYKIDRHLCHGVYRCTHHSANMPILPFHLHLPFSNSCVCVTKHVHVFFSNSIFIHTYLHVHMYDLCSVLWL